MVEKVKKSRRIGPFFTLELKLDLTPKQQHILNKRFAIYRDMYNTTLSYAAKQWRLIEDSVQHQELLQSYKKLSEMERNTSSKDIWNQKRQISKELWQLRKDYGLSQDKLRKHISLVQSKYKSSIDSGAARTAADRVWRQMCSKMTQRTKTHYKRSETLKSIEGKDNKAGIRLRKVDEAVSNSKDNYAILWLDLEVPVIIRNDDLFVKESLANYKVKRNRIIRKLIRGKYVYYVQIMLDGIPPKKN